MCLRRLIKVNNTFNGRESIQNRNCATFWNSGQIYDIGSVRERWQVRQQKMRRNSQIRVISLRLHLIPISLWTQICQLSEGVLFSMSLCVQGDWRGTFWGHCCSRVLLWGWCVTLYSADPWSKFNPFTLLFSDKIRILHFDRTSDWYYWPSQSVNHCHSNGVVHRDLKVGFLPFTS